MKKGIFLSGALLICLSNTNAQNKIENPNENIETRVQTLEQAYDILKQLKISGYIQAQYQYGEPSSSLRVGAGNTNKDEDYSRIGIRRGRIKFDYSKGLANGVLQLDITEKGIGLKDAYININDPLWGSSSLKAGVFNRPFGYEISYSSSRRASPERAQVITTLFPEERDLGLMLSLKAQKSSPWHVLQLDLALISGNGIKWDLDNKKDFIARASFQKSWHKKYQLGLGYSFYAGKVYQGSAVLYKMNGKSFEKTTDSALVGTFHQRTYVGVDVQFQMKNEWGNTNIYGEYLWGTQPGTATSSKSPNYSSFPTDNTYIRKFAGGYLTLVQELGKSSVSAVLKYDFYDPNTQISKDEIGLNETGKGDLSYQTWGAGLLWDINSSLRLVAYYDWIQNETSNHLSNYQKDLKDNVATLRLQYKF